MSGQAIIWVALGGALGAVGRYLVGLSFKAASGFPWATMSVNILGSFLMGPHQKDCVNQLLITSLREEEKYI